MADASNDAPEVADGVPVTINGKEVLARKGELVIETAERHGVYIPRFCYHSRMRPVGMCRMCIVEVDTGRGPSLQPTCMLEATPGMKLDTESEVTKKAQDGILEFLLVNHPLDCPVCDKGGECPLQDQTMAYGPGESRFVEEKRHFAKPIPISDLVYLDRERCILCDRCTRFAKEVAGDPLIHFMHRGNNTEVNTFPDHPFASYFSGNTVQICPVGALTSSSYRFKARPWDLQQSESTCQGCSVGCRVAVQSSRNEVLRLLGVDVDPVNWGWLCDKGRFGFEAVVSDERLREPLVRRGEQLTPARWGDALRGVADALRDAEPQRIGVLGGARLTNEDAYAWAKLAKGVLGTDNVDCQLADGLPAEAVLGLPKATIDDVCRRGGTVILVGPDLKEELPVLYLRLRHAVHEDRVRVIEVAPQAGSTSALASVALHHRPGEANEVARALVAGLTPGKDGGGVDPAALAAARQLLDAADGPVTVVVGRQSLAESAEFVVDAASTLLAGLDGVRFLVALRRANVHGALDMGLSPGFLPGRVDLDGGRAWFAAAWDHVPEQRGLDATGILRRAAAGELDVLVLLGCDPLADFPDRALAEQALQGAGAVVALDQFLTGSSARADVVLPVAGFAEVQGTTTNLEGRVSVLHQQVTAPGTARTDWMIAAELAALLGADFGLESAAQIWDEIESLAPSHAGLTWERLHDPANGDGVLVIPSGEEAEVAGNVAPSGEDAAAEAAEDETSGDDVSGEQVPDGPAAPACYRFVAAPAVEPAALDGYALRLVATRKLYDQGTLVQQSRSLRGLVPGTVLRVNPYDFDRLGVAEGQGLRVKTPRGSLRARVVVDHGVPRGSAAVYVNQPDLPVTELMDAAQRVTDVRLDTGAGA